MKRKITKILLIAASTVLILSLTACDMSSIGSIRGKNGKDGENGLDAYELAVQNGFDGTLDEWLESLKGSDGKDGVDGEDGKDGKNGKNGVDGVDGKDGLNAPGSLDGQLLSSFVVVTEYVEPNTGEDVSAQIQNIIDTNPNRTIYFPDGEYVIAKPICTPANPEKSVSLLLSNYAVIKASDNWSSSEAMIRLGGKDAKNDINTNGSNYYLEGGIIDGNGVAKGVSIDHGRETRVANVSIKHTLVGLHIKYGANSGSSDADIDTVNIVGNSTLNSIGVLVEGYDNTLAHMRIASVQIGVKLSVGGNFLRDIHPLYIYGNQLNFSNYSKSIGFWDTSGGNWYDICYSDQFATGFKKSGGGVPIYESCYCYWYTNHGAQTGFEFTDTFKGIIKNSKVAFHKDSPYDQNAYIRVGTNGGGGVIENPIFDIAKSGDKTYETYLSGKVIW